jgi:dolichyl-phosphate beta-glucosyltransferase
VPAYNEERRLERALRVFEESAATTVAAAGLELAEIVIVDDGSADRTPELLRAAAARDHLVQPLLRGGHNEGKGAALAAGVRVARGELTLLSDVDQSTPLEDIGKLYARLVEGTDLAIGSRDVPGSDVAAPEYRKQIGRVFNAMVRRLTGLPFKDTQCGFKLMRTDTARTLLEHQLVSGYAFDVELLMRARAKGLRVVEVPVTYIHDNDSRVNPLTASPRMALDLMRLVYRLRLRRGRNA